MRRHAKASPTAPTATPLRGRRGPLALAGLLAVVATIFAVGAASADTTPSVSIAPPSAVTYTTAHLAGMVNPNGGPTPTEWHFEYSETGAEGSYAWAGNGELSGPAAEGTSPVAVESELTGLKAGAFYFVRLVASNEFGGNSAVASTTLFTESIASPGVSISAPSSITSSSAHFEGAINPEGTDPAFDVNWHFQCEPECPGLAGTVAAGTSPQTVEADAAGLLPGKEYEVSLVAKNAGEPVSAGPESFTTDPVAPQVSDPRAVASANGATLSARLNPGGAATSYRFEYGPTASYGSATAPVTVSGGNSAKLVKATIAGLPAASAHHFRIVATNAAGMTEGGDQAFTTQPLVTIDSCPNATIRAEQGAADLPDCRAWEKVSPDDKNNSDVPAQTTSVISSADGDGVAFQSKGAFAGAEGASVTTGYLARRASGAWKTTGTTPTIGGETTGALHNRLIGPFSPDLSRALIRNHWTQPLTGDAQDQVITPYVRNTLTGGYVNVAPSANPLTTGVFASSAVYAGASDDFGNVLLQSNQPLLAAGPPAGTYAYEFANGGLRVASIVAGEPVQAFAGIQDGNFGQKNPVAGTRSVSRDGTKTVFVTLADSQVYVRGEGRETLHASASQRTDCAEQDPCTGAPAPDPEGVKPAAFITMSGDGSAVLFVSQERLTDDAFLGQSSTEGSNLYLFDPLSGELTNLSAGSSSLPQLSALDVFAVSDDGGTVFFGAEKLTADAPSQARNLYVWREGAVRFVTELGEFGHTTEQIRGGNFRTALTTPDGSMLAFSSDVPLKGESFRAASPDRQCPAAAGDCRQMYVYDARTDELNCVSCGWPDRPTGDAGFTFATYGVPEIDDMVARAVSDDGSRVFFDSPDALVPADTNGRYDVYEWVASGTGGCAPGAPAFQAEAGGCIHLLSSGLGNADSHFQDADPSGDNVFFVSGSQLVGTDRDVNLDLYVARAGGGLPGQLGASEQSSCAGEACQGPPSAAPPPTAVGAAATQASTNRATKRKSQRAKHRKRGHVKGKKGHRGKKAAHGPGKRGGAKRGAK